jgi:hypothetical protein
MFLISFLFSEVAICQNTANGANSDSLQKAMMIDKVTADKVVIVLDGYSKEFRNLMASKEKSNEGGKRYKKVQELVAERDKKLKSILTSDQYQRMVADVKERAAEKHQEFMEKIKQIQKQEAEKMKKKG